MVSYDDDFWSVFYHVYDYFSRKKTTRMKAATTALGKLFFVARERAEFSSSELRTSVWNELMKIQAIVTFVLRLRDNAHNSHLKV